MIFKKLCKCTCTNVIAVRSVKTYLFRMYKMRIEWFKCFIAISAYVFAVCDPVHGATNTIINMTLVDGQTPNEGRVEYFRSEDSTWVSACGNGFGYADASVICRQLGYPGVNNFIVQDKERPFGTGGSIAQHILTCNGDEENLARCPLTMLSTGTPCYNTGGVICHEKGYTGCYPYSALAHGDLQTPCEYGFDDSQIFTIANCVSLCNNISNTYTYAGLYLGDMCFCGSSSANISKSDMEVTDCSAPCAGRNIERCGGNMHIALFNITLFLQNTNWIAGPIGCEESTQVPTEGDVTATTVSNVSSSSPSHSSMHSTSHTMTEGTSSMTVQTNRGDVTTTTVNNVSSSSPSHSSVHSTSHTMTEGKSSMTVQTNRGMTSDMGSRTPTGMPQRTTTERPMGMTGNLGLYIGVGAGGGVLVLILLILMIVFIKRWRRSKDKRSSKDHTILELRSRPEGSDLDVYPHPSASSHNYSLENGHTNPMVFNDIMEDSDYSVIAETSMNARNSSAYEHVPQLESTSDNLRSPQPEPRISVREGQYSMHPDTSELYTKPDKSQQENGHSDSFPVYAVSQKVRKEHIGQAVPELPPSALNPEDVAGLYTMPDKSKKTTKLLDRNMDSDMGIDNALYICRGDEDAEVARESSKYAVGNNDVDMDAEEGGDSDTEMIENEFYETSDRHT